MASWEKEQTLGFIELYRHHECLWKIKSEEYSNRQLRNYAYATLVEYMKNEINMSANRDDVLKKINNMRSAFRKELKKIEQAKIDQAKSGAGPQELYQPRLWYFEELLFLGDQDNPQPQPDNYKYSIPQSLPADIDNATLEDPDPGGGDVATWLPSTAPKQLGNCHFSSNTRAIFSHSVYCCWKLKKRRKKCIDSIANSDVEAETFESLDIKSPQSPSSMNSSLQSSLPVYQPAQEVKQNSKKRKGPEDELFTIACNNTSRYNSSIRDRLDIFGQHIASTIREMPAQQQIFAEKIISDVLFEGRLGNLSRASCFDGSFINRV